jgi:hypothetical protein
MPPKLKVGRPRRGDDKRDDTPLTVVHVALDRATLDALDLLKAEVHGPQRGKTSIAVRQAIHDAAEQRRGSQRRST